MSQKHIIINIAFITSVINSSITIFIVIITVLLLFAFVLSLKK